MQNPLVKAMGYGKYALEAGVDNALQGTVQFFTGDEKVTSAKQFGSQELASDLEGGSKLLYSALNTVGNMAPSILVGSITGGPVGTVAMGISAAGNSYNQLLAAGYGVGEARAVSTLVGASEAALQHLLGGVSKLSSGMMPEALARVAKLEGLYNTVGGKLLMSIGSEVIEEETQLFLEPLIKTLILDVPYDAPNWDEVAETALTTILSTGMLEGAPIAADAAVGKAQQVADRPLEKFPNRKIPAPAQAPAGAVEVEIPTVSTKILMQIKNDPEALAELGIETEGRTDREVMDDIRATVTLHEMVRQVVNNAAQTQQAVDEAQSVPYNEKVETEQATVENRGVTLYITEGGLPKAEAETAAQIVQDLIDHKHVGDKALEKLKLNNPKFRQIFTELTGVQFPETTSKVQIRKLARSAHEVAQQKQAEMEQVQDMVSEVETPSAQNEVQNVAPEIGRAHV